MEELKRCPFCGRKGYLKMSNYKSDGAHWHFVECEECMATGPVGRTEQDAIDAWNQREGEQDE